MRVLLVHPSALMYSEIFLRLEPLGLERVAAALLAAGHDVRLIDLQVYRAADLRARLTEFAARGGRLLASTTWPTCPRSSTWPSEIKTALPRLPASSSAGTAPRSSPSRSSRTPTAPSTACSAARARPARPRCSRRSPDRRRSQAARRGHRRTVPGRRRCCCTAWTMHCRRAHLGGAAPQVLHRRARPVRLDRVHPRLPVGLLLLQRLDLLRPQLPQAVDPRPPARTWPASREPGVFIVDDVAFIQAEHGTAIADEIERRGIRKQYYLETRCDVLLRNRGGVPPLEAARACTTCSSASRRSTRRA